ncbi:hypothetical protein [Streptomyces spiralis]
MPRGVTKDIVQYFCIGEQNKSLPECTDFADSLQNSTGSFTRTVAPNGAGTTPRRVARQGPVHHRASGVAFASLRPLVLLLGPIYCPLP